MEIISKVYNYFTSDIETKSYDELSNELKAVMIHGSVYSGGRTEITKTIGRNLQFYTCMSIGDLLGRNGGKTEIAPKNVQFGCVMAGNGKILNLIIDGNTLQSRLSLFTKNIVVKYENIISKINGIHSQVSLDYKNKFGAISLKYITPSFPLNTNVVVMNYVKKIYSKMYFGIENILTDVTGKKELGISITGRYEAKNHISSLSVQQFTSFCFSYVRKFNEMFKFANEIHFSPFTNNFYSSFGIRLDTYKSIVKSEISTNLKLSLQIEERLFEGMVLNIGTEVDLLNNSNIFGFGISYEC